jgi:hypothetical protein
VLLSNINNLDFTPISPGAANFSELALEMRCNRRIANRNSQISMEPLDRYVIGNYCSAHGSYLLRSWAFLVITDVANKPSNG